jgi:hypothetical protein
VNDQLHTPAALSKGKWFLEHELHRLVRFLDIEAGRAALLPLLTTLYRMIL